MEIIPNEGRVVLRTAKKEEITKEHITYHGTSDEDIHFGVVVSTHDGELSSWLGKGDRVLFNSYDCEGITIGGRKYSIIEQDKIIAKLREEK